MHELNEQEIQELYDWIDQAKFSRPKRNITRDFSDGVACAELIHHFLPKLVDLHNYSPANSLSQKLYNWNTLNFKVFKKLGYVTSDEIIHCIVTMRPGYVEYLLYELRIKIENYHSHTPHPPVVPPPEPAPKVKPVVKEKVVQEPYQPDAMVNPIIHEMNETIKILQLKVSKLEELLTLKDGKIRELSRKLRE
ncbi:Ankyrin repeat and zinc finger domain-containing protein 1 [Boothiomyces sp. JEL0838]|nr:Ankyrin repeat and zinc finger domain-containing protein 1 [Boothiomyces sp. JEL0838]